MFVDFCVHCLSNRRIINVLMMMMKIHTVEQVRPSVFKHFLLGL